MTNGEFMETIDQSILEKPQTQQHPQNKDMTLPGLQAIQEYLSKNLVTKQRFLTS